MRYDDYMKVISENFDIMHTDTRKILLAIDEEDKSNVLASLTSKLYDNIVNKVDDIDFGTIPKSEGDIEKIENYEELCACIQTIRGLLVEYRQSAKPIDIIVSAINNCKQRKEMFEKAYRYKVELPVVMYSTIVLSIVSSVSFLISTCIDYIKEPNADDFQIVLDKTAFNKSKDNLLFKNLEKFNIACDRGQIDETIDYVIKKNIKNLTGMSFGIIASGAIVSVIVLNIIPIIRELIFFFYYSRTKMSDYLEIQSNLLKMNVYNLENNEAIPKKDKTQIIKKQNKIADFLQKLANKISIDNKKAEKDTIKEITSSQKKYKIDDVVDSVPDSATSAIF